MTGVVVGVVVLAVLTCTCVVVLRARKGRRG